MNDKCKNIVKNVLIAILLIISLVLIIIGIIRHNKLWLLGVFFLILAFIVGYLSFRNNSNKLKLFISLIYPISYKDPLN
jgi:uncharacterized membrane protein YozB (DUF420 family)